LRASRMDRGAGGVTVVADTLPFLNDGIPKQAQVGLYQRVTFCCAFGLAAFGKFRHDTPGTRRRVTTSR
ncbi:MAG TPA: hypothetical protein VG498_11075, partial [Terriglobales bacterium]|nr:hypothetical protein [Terriglobales bacterium]